MRSVSKALKWDDRLADACGCEGIVLRDDESDGTAQVHKEQRNEKNENRKVKGL